jgi:type VI secretion system protein
MKLTIKAVIYKEKPLEPPLTAVFDQRGGSVGRSKGNHLVLADNEKVVSSTHANIKYQNGGYYYVDNSLNGTLFINRNQLVRHKKIQLQDKDRLQIGDYDLLINITGQNADILQPLDPMPVKPLSKQKPLQEDSSVFLFDQDNDEKRIGPKKAEGNEDDHFFDSSEKEALTGHSKPITSQNNEHNAEADQSSILSIPRINSKENSDLPDDLTLEDFFGNEEPNPKASSDDQGDKTPSSPSSNKSILKKLEQLVNSQTNPKEVQPSSGLQNRAINDPSALAPHSPFKKSKAAEKISNARSGRQSHHRPGPAPIPTHPNRSQHSIGPTTSSDRWLKEFFKAAGMEEIVDLEKCEISDLMQTLGTILREAIQGLMTILRGRSELKSQLRVVMTTFKETENNPLKFSPTAEMVLKIFLIDKNLGFLDAVEAIREGFQDVKNHESAINAGVQASLLDTLKRFEPHQFEKKFEERLVMNKKARCWKEYKQTYQQLMEEALEDFFGKEFVRAYEEQMDKLRPARKG